MVKKGTKKPRKLVKPDRFPLIDRELCKRTKADLISMILAIAREHAVVVWSVRRQPDVRQSL